jgi:hypothetical protein
MAIKRNPMTDIRSGSQPITLIKSFEMFLKENGDNQDDEKANGNMAYHVWSPYFLFCNSIIRSPSNCSMWVYRRKLEWI